MHIANFFLPESVWKVSRSFQETRRHFKLVASQSPDWTDNHICSSAASDPDINIFGLRVKTRARCEKLGMMEFD